MYYREIETKAEAKAEYNKASKVIASKRLAEVAAKKKLKKASKGNK
jgi:hypothetical protein